MILAVGVIVVILGTLNYHLLDLIQNLDKKHRETSRSKYATIA
jgi:hypothetical protein